MKININKDFLSEYKNDFWKGFSITDIVHILEGFIFGALVVALLYFAFNVPVAMGMYIFGPAAAPIIFFGFYKYQGYMPVKEFIKEYIFTHSSERILYESEEKDIVRVFYINKNEGKDK